MTDKIDLPDGGWARIRDPKKTPERLVRPLKRLNERVLASGVSDYLRLRGQEGVSDEDIEAALKPIIGTDDWGRLDEVDDQLVAALVEEWSFDSPITAESVMDLPGDARRELIKQCSPLMGALLGWVTDEEVMDPTRTSQQSNG